MNGWDNYHLSLAKMASSKSKDPSTKVGAVIVRPDYTVAATGYNGFPRGIKDTRERLNDRDTKLSMMVHAEINAILTAHEPVKGHTLYTWPFPPCSHCTLLIIQSGIKRVVAPSPSADLNARWSDSLKLSASLFNEAGVELKVGLL